MVQGFVRQWLRRWLGVRYTVMPFRRPFRKKPRNSKPANAKWVIPTIRILKQMNLEKFKSRKLWVAVISAALVALGEGIGLDANTVLLITGIASSYILGQGIADAGSQGAKE